MYFTVGINERVGIAMKTRENEIRIIENKEKNRLDAARFSVTYKTPKSDMAVRERAYKILVELASGNDAIMEINSGFTGPHQKNNSEEKSMQEFVDEFKRLGIAYKHRKVPSMRTSLLGKLFFSGSSKEDDEIMAYVDNEMLLSEDVMKLLPVYGVRFYFAKRNTLLRGDEERYNAISRFLDLLDNEKLSLIEMAVFIFVYLGQVGICTEKIDIEDLRELLKNE